VSSAWLMLDKAIIIRKLINIFMIGSLKLTVCFP
jgi:hypothetical protein